MGSCTSVGRLGRSGVTTQLGGCVATITDVARRAGVSVSTVSYALSGARPIRPETRARIERAMRDLGYQPNAMARSLASRRSRVIALIYPADHGVGRTGGEFIQAAVTEARKFDYHLVLWPFPAGQQAEVQDLVKQRMADGVLIMEVFLDDDRIDLLEAEDIPYVMIGRTRDVSHRHSVDIDFQRTIVEAIGQLTELGHREIAFVNHSQSSLRAGYGPTVRAAEAYEGEMIRLGLEPLMCAVDDSPLAGRQAITDLLKDHPELTAVITMNELATFGMLAELQRRGLKVPDDISVMGVVTTPAVATMSSPTLTTMHSPGEQLGRLAVDSLLSQLEPDREPVSNRIIPCVLEPGMSVGPVATTRGLRLTPPAT